MFNQKCLASLVIYCNIFALIYMIRESHSSFSVVYIKETCLGNLRDTETLQSFVEKNRVLVDTLHVISPCIEDVNWNISRGFLRVMIHNETKEDYFNGVNTDYILVIDGKHQSKFLEFDPVEISFGVLKDNPQVDQVVFGDHSTNSTNSTWLEKYGVNYEVSSSTYNSTSVVTFISKKSLKSNLTAILHINELVKESPGG